MLSCSQFLIQQLELWGVEHVFGIPGVHTIELYRSLEGSSLRHLSPRHEQGAGFMADGYARASGKPGVCFIITGPGMSNIMTAMGQALADSVPMLVVSSVGRLDTLGSRQGRLHELASQRDMVSNVARFSQTILDPEQLPGALARAFALFKAARPGPVHIEIPIDLLDAPLQTPLRPNPPLFYSAGVTPQAIETAASWLTEASRPLLLIGGGCASAAASVQRLAELLDAPVITTINAKGVLPGTINSPHPLDLGANGAFQPVRELAAAADVILALGTEIGETDYDVVFDDGFALNGRLIRVDIDAEQVASHNSLALGIVSDARSFAEALALSFDKPLDHNGNACVIQIRKALNLAHDDDFGPYLPLYQNLETYLPDAILVGDSTTPVYAGNHLVSQRFARRYFNASTGYGTLGYALPAALGAKVAKPDLRVVALVGDGGLMFTVAELATMMQEGINVLVIIWNNCGYEEIRRYMDKAGVERLGVNIIAPKFKELCGSMKAPYCRVTSPETLASALKNWSQQAPLVIEIQADSWLDALED